VNPARTQAEQILAALETARRLGWEVVIRSGRGGAGVFAKRTALFAGTRQTEHDYPGITIIRPTLRDALAHLLMICNLDAAPDAEMLARRERDDLAEMHEAVTP
jgi:hypothetical protein